MLGSKRGVVKPLTFLSKTGNHHTDTDKMIFCPRCGSEHTTPRSFNWVRAVYRCLSCNKRFFR